MECRLPRQGRKVLALIVFLAQFFALYPASLKKVIILDIVQTEPNQNYAYLEDSLTSAIADMLKQKFAFAQFPKTEWEKVMRDNYLFRQDMHTRSVGMTLGLLAKQDIVLQGHYHVEESGKRKKKKYTLVTTIRLLDISKKKVLAEFTEKSPVDNTLFTSIARLAEKTAKAASAVLPNKNTWNQKEAAETSPRVPMFARPFVAVAAGAGFLQSGVADRVKTKPPYLGFRLGSFMPLFSESLRSELRFGMLNASPRSEKNPNLSSLTVDTTNLLFHGRLGWELSFFSNSIHLTPFLGGGIIYQINGVSGAVNDNISYAIPTPLAGFDIAYQISPMLKAVLTAEGILEVESSAQTILLLTSVGVQYQWAN